MQSFCLHPSPTCAKLPHDILALISALDISATRPCVKSVVNSGKSLSLRDRKSDADLQTGGTVGLFERQLDFLSAVYSFLPLPSVVDCVTVQIDCKLEIS